MLLKKNIPKINLQASTYREKSNLLIKWTHGAVFYCSDAQILAFYIHTCTLFLTLTNAYFSMSSLHLWFSKLKWSMDVLLRFYERHAFICALHKVYFFFTFLIFTIQAWSTYVTVHVHLLYIKRSGANVFCFLSSLHFLPQPPQQKNYLTHNMILNLFQETKLLFDELNFCLQRLFSLPFHVDMPFNSGRRKW